VRPPKFLVGLDREIGRADFIGGVATPDRGGGVRQGFGGGIEAIIVLLDIII
jgi:hypothetical protein